MFYHYAIRTGRCRRIPYLDRPPDKLYLNSLVRFKKNICSELSNYLDAGAGPFAVCQ